MKLLVPYDWTKGRKIASDILRLHVTFSVAFHLFFFFFLPWELQRECKRQYSSIVPLLPLRLSTKAVSGTKLQLSHITTQVRNAVLGGGGVGCDRGHTGM